MYRDNFKIDESVELKKSGQIDNYDNKLVNNNTSIEKYHSNWLNMIYLRLKIARNLLTNDGVIFISIDNNEYTNLKTICDEIFGE